MGDKRKLARHTHPCPILTNPRISEVAATLVWLTLVHAFDAVDSLHHGAISVNVCVHGLRHLLLGTISGRLHTRQKIALGLQSTIVVGVTRELSDSASSA